MEEDRLDRVWVWDDLWADQDRDRDRDREWATEGQLDRVDRADIAARRLDILVMAGMALGLDRDMDRRDQCRRGSMGLDRASILVVRVRIEDTRARIAEGMSGMAADRKGVGMKGMEEVLRGALIGDRILRSSRRLMPGCMWERTLG
jgi:hypothetical protein